MSEVDKPTLAVLKPKTDHRAHPHSNKSKGKGGRSHRRQETGERDGGRGHGGRGKGGTGKEGESTCGVLLSVRTESKDERASQ